MSKNHQSLHSLLFQAVVEKDPFKIAACFAAGLDIKTTVFIRKNLVIKTIATSKSVDLFYQDADKKDAISEDVIKNIRNTFFSKLNETLNSLFLKATHEKNLKKMTACFILGLDVNTYNSKGRPAFFKASESPEMLQVFLGQPNIDVNIKDRKIGTTAMMHLVTMNNLECLKKLSAVPCVDWNIKCNAGWSPLTLAAEYDSTDILRFLLTVPGIDLNITDIRGRNIAQIVVEKIGGGHRLDSLKLLAGDSRINWNIKNENGDTPIMHTWKMRLTVSFGILMDVPTVDKSEFIQDAIRLQGTTVTDKKGRNIAQFAKKNYCSMFIKLSDLLPRDSQVIWNINNESGIKPIQFEWKMRRTEMLRILRKIQGSIKRGFTAPECPVCCENFRQNSKIFQCDVGHFVCESCNQKVKVCPKCRRAMNGKRCHDFEQLLQSLNI